MHPARSDAVVKADLHSLESEDSDLDMHFSLHVYLKAGL